MANERLRQLLSEHAPYQEVEMGGKSIAKGMRECERRWKMIKPHIKHNSVIVDVGSDLGYFTIKIAEEFRDSLVISVEQAERACEIQKELLKLAGLSNVVLCRHKMDLRTLRGLDATVEAIDTFLALSVFHHYPLEVVRQELSYLSRISPELIVEVPKVFGNADNITGGKQYSNFDQELKKYYDHVEVIGESTLSPHQKRIIYKAWNEHLVRENLAPTFVFDLNEKCLKRVHKLEYKGGKWIFDGRERKFITGVNAWTLLYWNPICPESEWWQNEAGAAYERLLRGNVAIGDIKPFNLIVTPNGMRAIDYCEGYFELRKAKADIEKVRQVFENMDNFVQTTFRLFVNE